MEAIVTLKDVSGALNQAGLSHRELQEESFRALRFELSSTKPVLTFTLWLDNDEIAVGVGEFSVFRFDASSEGLGQAVSLIHEIRERGFFEVTKGMTLYQSGSGVGPTVVPRGRRTKRWDVPGGH